LAQPRQPKQNDEPARALDEQTGSSPCAQHRRPTRDGPLLLLRRETQDDRIRDLIHGRHPETPTAWVAGCVRVSRRKPGRAADK